jgi:parallel beta helix pectate lyase-like protein
VLGGVIVSTDGATSITINITAATDAAKSVRLRGLAINGTLKAGNGVKVVAANKVVIEDCVISNFKETGISVAAGTVYVRNTTVSYNRVGINVTGGQVGLNDVSVIFNNAGLAGDTMIVRHNNVVLFGNSQ